MIPRSRTPKKKTLTQKPKRARAVRTQHGAAQMKAVSATTKSDVVSLLRTDHANLRQLLTGLVSADTPSERQRLLGQVKQELQAHTQAEEEIFYEAFRAATQTDKDEQRFHEALAEHHAADTMLQEVASATDAAEQFRGRAKVLKEIVEHHLGEEEHDVFPRARKLIGASELLILGDQLAARKRALLHGNSVSNTLQRVANFVTSSFASATKATQGSRA